MNLDAALVFKLLELSSLEQLRDAGISPQMLFDKPREALEYILWFYKEYGRMPDRSTVEETIGFNFEAEVPEPFQYYADKVLERWLGNTVGEYLKKAVVRLGDGDPRGAVLVVKELLKHTAELDRKQGEGLVDLTKTTTARWERYENLRRLDGKIDGIPTPWPSLDDLTRGIHAGEFWLVLGRLGIGKSFFLSLMASKMWELGYRPLLVTMEMSVELMSQRWDSVSAGLPYSDFRKGMLGKFVEEKYCRYLQDMSGKHSMWIVGNGRVKTPVDLDILVSELSPDVLLIDGVYLIGVEGKYAGKYERVSAVADALQALAQRKQIPIIGTSQFTRKITREKRGGSEHVGFALELAQNCSVGIELHRNKDLELARQMLVGLFKHREGVTFDLLVEWDLENMRFQEICVLDDKLAKRHKEQDLKEEVIQPDLGIEVDY